MIQTAVTNVRAETKYIFTQGEQVCCLLYVTKLKPVWYSFSLSHKRRIQKIKRTFCSQTNTFGFNSVFS